MSNDQVRQVMLETFGLRIGAHMTQYVRRRLLMRDRAAVPVIGGDARTGVAIRTIIALQALERAATGGDAASSDRSA